MASLVNSTKHWREKLYQFSTSCSRKQKQREHLVTHSTKLHPSNTKTKILITRKGSYRPIFPMNIRCKNSQQNISKLMGLPRWRSGWESACQCREHRFEPWSGKIPHAMKQLSPWATTTEPAHLEPVLRNKRGRYSERPAHRDEEWPPLATTRESPHTETKTQHSHK